MSDIYRELWDKNISKMTRKSNAEGLENYKNTIQNTSGVDDSIKEEYIQKCEEAKNAILAKQEEVAMESSEATSAFEDDITLDGDDIDAEDVTVGESARHTKMSKAKLVGLVAGGIALAAVVGATIHSCNSCAPAKAIEETTTSEDEEKDDEIVINSTIKPTLAFDTEDTEVMIGNLKEFAKGVLPNGIELTDAELEEQVESLINYYVWLNLNEIGPSYLSELYQTDSVSYIEIFSDSMYWANVLRFDSITSSAKDNTVVDLSMMISNKKDLELVQSFQNLNARLHDAVDANDVATIKGIVSEYQTLIETKLLDHVSYSYGQGAMDLCFRLVYSGEQLLADYDVVIMDESLSKIINEDTFLKCIQSISISTIEDKTYTKEEIEQTIQVNTSKKSDNVIYQIDVLKDYMTRLNMQLDFTGKKSVADVMVEVSAYVRENNLLSTYKENESLEVFFARIYEQTHVEKETVQQGDIVIDNNNYIKKEELDKYNVDTKEEYEQAVKNEVESSLENEKTFTDNTGKVVESGSNAEDFAAAYSSGYTAGSKQGAIDGNALATEKSIVSGSEGYVAGYAAGYKEAYAEAKQKRLNAEKETSVKTETVKPIEQSSEVIEQGTLKQPETTTEKQTTTSSSNKEEETTTTIIKEEVIEEGLLTPSSEEVTLSYDELYNIYYQALYGSNSVEEETTYSKTR